MSTHSESIGEEKGAKYGDRRIQCVVVTPERTWLDELVNSVVLPAYDGELGVLPGHTPLIARLGYGELRTRRAMRCTATSWTEASRRCATTWSRS